MKRRLTITPDNKPAGVRVILASRKGHILYDRQKDRTRNKKRPRAERESAGGEREVTNESEDSLPRNGGKRND